MSAENLNSDENPSITTNKEEADSIQPINRTTVHRICSGQVVLSLAIAVKELVENAIDAGATNIEVRLKDYGNELVEVSDNGYGVRQENFQALTLKHYTSKLREFTDLESVATLGFRGEALSSLCALSDLCIITRHASAEHATKISYDSGGKITSELPSAREIGTTVSLSNLFASLPVRRKEFTKNLKREYSKMCQLLYAYCLVSKGIKFKCTNQTPSGSCSTVVSTEGSNSVRENIITIFGTKQVQSLVNVNMVDPDEDILDEYKIKLSPNEPLPFNFECIVSSAVHGSGRSTSDRQFVFINQRPCDANKIMKLVNHSYKQYNLHQYPFVFLNIIMDKSLVDVNVTPSKRQIFLEKEKLLLATLKTSLRDAFKNCPSTYNITQHDRHNDTVGKNSLKRSLSNVPCKSSNGTFFESFKRATKSKSDSQLTQSSSTDINTVGIVNETPEKKLIELLAIAEELEQEIQIKCPAKKLKFDDETNILSVSPSKEIPFASPTVEMSSASPPKQVSSGSPPNQILYASPPQEIISASPPKEFPPKVEVNIQATSKLVPDSTFSQNKVNVAKNDLVMDTAKTLTNSVTMRASMKYIKDILKSQQGEETKNVRVRFRSEITPAANKSAEQELQRQITKDMFKKMEIIGQFNLGFMITKLEDDLFIVDQHASDEKYNFEELQRNTVLESQVLVNPRHIELSAANEELLIENEEVFQKNGFKFIIDTKAPATKKVKLSAIPISKNYIFGKDDIEEMLFMMQEDVNHSICRPSRVRSMFASRACRKSVMVGCPLNRSDMRRLIDHMGEIDQPWNCPHGRPTIRHLINLNLIDK